MRKTTEIMDLIQKDLFDLVPETIVVLNLNSEVLAVNKRITTLLGYEPFEVIGKKIAELPILTIKSKTVAVMKFAHRLLDREIAPYELTFKAKSGKEIIGRVSGKLVRDSDGNIVADLVLITEVTSLEQSRMNAINNKDIAQKYLDIVGVILIVIDRDGRLQLINKKGCEILEYTQDELIGKDWINTCLPIHVRERMKPVFDQIVSGKLESAEYFENTILTKSGNERLIAWHNSLLLDERGKVMAVLSSGEDKTQQRKIEHEIKESEEKFRIIYEHAPDGIFLMDLDGMLLDINKTAEQLSGYSRGEVVGKKVTDLHLITQNKDLARALKDISNVISTGKIEGAEYFLRRKDGSSVLVGVRAYVIKLGEKNVVLGIARDMSGLRTVEQKVWQLTQAIQQSPVSVVMTDIGGDITYVNPKFCEVSGYVAEEVLGKNPRMLNSGKNDPDIYKELWKTIAAGGVWQGEICNKRKDGTLYWEFASIAGVKDEDGQVVNYIAVKEDITKQKEAQTQLEHRHQELDRMNKLMVGRELRMIEMKQQLKELMGQMGEK